LAPRIRAAISAGKKMGAELSAQSYQRRRMKLQSLLPLYIFNNLYSNSNARFLNSSNHTLTFFAWIFPGFQRTNVGARATASHQRGAQR
jgi:hypothetical protein